MVPGHFFSVLVRKQTKNFLEKGYIAPLQLGKNWKARLIDDHSDLKRPPYWLPGKKISGGH